MTTTIKKNSHPEFQTNDEGKIRIASGEFKGTIFEFRDIDMSPEKVLSYNSHISVFMINGEDVTTTHTDKNEAKFLNTVSTPVFTTIIEGLQQLESMKNEQLDNTEDSIDVLD